ncbi:expressed unknown protein [Seminavis robusta]|uniref:Uncharacterized protein n=1 Tax=Seminavis robusta TaxID=568900 RepID=A0A9N8D8I9_9STRA|nr:expressed unknown protein [Seminavis robusta]|eukprot:Sro40_g024860.1 n/a (204) ;mRNA; f:119855-120466
MLSFSPFPVHVLVLLVLVGLHHCAASTRKIGVGCQLDFTFDRSKVARRPNSAEVDAIIQLTKLFYADKCSKLLNGEFVEVGLSDLATPKRLRGVDYTFRFRFFTTVEVTSDSSLGQADLSGLLSGLDYDHEYKENFVWKYFGTSDKSIFSSAIAVTFQQAGLPKQSIFGNVESEGPYFERKHGHRDGPYYDKRKRHGERYPGI